MKETFKTILLIFLIISSLVLGFLNIRTRDFTIPISVDAEISDLLLKYISPLELSYAQGGISYKRIYHRNDIDKIWNSVYDDIKLYITESNGLKLITKQEFYEYFTTKSILIKLPDISLTTLVKLKDDGSKKIYSGDEKFISEMLINFEKNTILFTDSVRYYAINSDIELTNLNVDEILALNDGYQLITYRTVRDRFSLDKVLKTDSFNYTLIPYEFNKYIYKQLAKPKFNLNDAEFANYISNMSSNIFLKDFDFIRKYITSDGSTTLTYDYGKTTLSFTPRSEIIYKNTVHSSRISTFESAFYTAVDFIENRLKPNSRMILKHYKLKGDEYTFSFIIGQSDYNLVYNSHDVMQISIKSDNISSVYLKDVVLSDMKDSAPSDIKGIDAIINQNESVLEENLTQDLIISKDDEQLFFKLRDNINDIDMIQYMNDEYEIKLSWRVVIADTVYIFDAVKGDILWQGGSDELAEN